MKFFSLNVDFSSPSPDPLGSRRLAQVGVKDGYPRKKWLFYRSYLMWRENGCFLLVSTSMTLDDL